MRLEGESFQALLPRIRLDVLSAYLPSIPIKKKSSIKCEKILTMYCRRSTSLLSHCTPLTNYCLLALLFFSYFFTHLLCRHYFEFKISSTVLPSLTVPRASYSPADGGRVSVPRGAPVQPWVCREMWAGVYLVVGRHQTAQFLLTGLS